jgi:uncharacterized protein
MDRILFLLLIFLTARITFAQIPAPKGWVNDYENILNESQEKELDSIITGYYKKTKREISIVTSSNILPYDRVSEFCLDLFHSWGIGHERENGLLIFVSAKLHEAHITAGTNTKKVLTPPLCRSIIEVKMVPHLKEKKYFLGIKSGLMEIMRKWKN